MEETVRRANERSQVIVHTDRGEPVPTGGFKRGNLKVSPDE